MMNRGGNLHQVALPEKSEEAALTLGSAVLLTGAAVVKEATAKVAATKRVEMNLTILRYMCRG